MQLACAAFERGNRLSLGRSLRSQLGAGISIVSLSLASITGCTSEPPIAPVSGRVEFRDGTPVKVGTLETKCKTLDGYQARGKINADGSFSLTTLKTDDGAVVGEHDCVVVQFIQLNESSKATSSAQGVVNRKHSSYSTSGLQFSVPEGGLNDLLLVVDGIGPKGNAVKGHSTHEEQPAEIEDGK